MAKLLKYSLLDSCWIVRTVSRLSGQFLNCPDSFWIVRTVFGLSGKFLDYPDSFWIVQIVFELSGQFFGSETFISRKGLTNMLF